MQQKIFTTDILRKMLANSRATGEALVNGTEEPDHKPVVKVFNPYGGATWLLTEIDEDGRCFGLCDLGQGFPELGYVLRSEIENLRIKRGGYGLPLERDAHFTADKPLSEYAADARVKQRISA
jgi:hypothetical protein